MLAWLLALAFSAVLALQAWYFGHVLWYARMQPHTTAFMQAELQRLREDDPRRTLRHQWVPYERISPHLARAVIAAEDARFLEHVGVDWEAIQDAFNQNLQRGSVVRGGSTITMQLAKNLFLSDARSYLRKGQELVITWMIEHTMDKRRILELYMNVAEWGEGVFGAEAAARRHFGVGANRLQPWQAARLAAMLPNPRYYERNPQAKSLVRRMARVTRGMPVVSLP